MSSDTQASPPKQLTPEQIERIDRRAADQRLERHQAQKDIGYLIHRLERMRRRKMEPPALEAYEEAINALTKRFVEAIPWTPRNKPEP